jgi:spore coat polysaccharide biosynthesis predicted glycosyltransferase SpsG
MQITFRADASPEIGTGHVMRCAAIAEEAILRGIPCRLVGTLGGIGWVESHLAEIGLPWVEVGDWVAGESSGVEILVIDSYSIPLEDLFLSDNRWQYRIVVADEPTPNYFANLVIHPGLDASWFKGDKRAVLFGAKYLPLRRIIQKSSVAQDKLGLSKVVVFGGGTDLFSFSTRIAKILTKSPIFSNASFFCSEKLGNEIRQMDHRFSAFLPGNKLIEELATSDLVLTTASTSSLEILAMEIPMGIACLVKNQISNSNALGRLGLAHVMQIHNEGELLEIDEESLLAFLANAKYRRQLQKNMEGFVDLKGSRRILDEIMFRTRE